VSTWVLEQHDGAGWVRCGAWRYDTRAAALDHADRIDAHRTADQSGEHPLRVVPVRGGPRDTDVGELLPEVGPAGWDGNGGWQW